MGRTSKGLSLTPYGTALGRVGPTSVLGLALGHPLSAARFKTVKAGPVSATPWIGSTILLASASKVIAPQNACNNSKMENWRALTPGTPSSPLACPLRPEGEHMLSFRTRVLLLCGVVTTAALFGSCSLLGYWIYVNETDFPAHPATGFDPAILLLADIFGFLYASRIAHVVVVATPVCFAVFLFRRGRLSESQRNKEKGWTEVR
jgi:hypothetical protein